MLLFAEAHPLPGTRAWIGVKEYAYPHPPGHDLRSILRWWSIRRDAEIFTGAEDADPPRHGPWLTRDGGPWDLFESATPEELLQVFVRWVRAESDPFVGGSPIAEAAANEALVAELLGDRLGDPRPAQVLLLDADGGSTVTVNANEMGIGVLGGFVEAVWVRPDDNRLVIVTGTDD